MLLHTQVAVHTSARVGGGSDRVRVHEHTKFEWFGLSIVTH